MINKIKNILEKYPNLTDGEKGNLNAWIKWLESGIEIKKGDIVQIDPSDPENVFGGNFLVIEESLGWGVSGYCMYLKKRKGFIKKQFHYKDTKPVGKAFWVLNTTEE